MNKFPPISRDVRDAIYGGRSEIDPIWADWRENAASGQAVEKWDAKERQPAATTFPINSCNFHESKRIWRKFRFCEDFRRGG